MKPLALGAERPAEFGESYHVATALQLDDSVRAVVVGKDKHFAKPFLLRFADTRRVSEIPAESYNKGSYEKVSRATSIYLKRWPEANLPALRYLAVRGLRSRIPEIDELLRRRLGPPDSTRDAALIWIRLDEHHEPARNSTAQSVSQLVELVEAEGIRAIQIGDRLKDSAEERSNLVEFYKEIIGPDRIALHLVMFERLFCNYGVRMSVGMKSGGMDGPGLFFGLPTVSFVSTADGAIQRIRNIAGGIRNFRVIFYKPQLPRFREHTQEDREQLRKQIHSFGLGR